MTDPAFRRRENADSAEIGRGTGVEPVCYPGRYADEIVPFADHAENATSLAKIKRPRAVHEEAHFVIVMRVLCEEFPAQFLAVRVVGLYTHDIDAPVAAFFHDPRHIVFIGFQHGFLIGLIRQSEGRFPALESHANTLESLGDLSAVARIEQNGVRIRIGIDGEMGHLKPSS